MGSPDESRRAGADATSVPPSAIVSAMAAGKLHAVAGATDSETDFGPSARFERGELTVDEYLEALVDNAVALVQGKLPADRTEWLREMLREQLVSDPVLQERVRQATRREPQTG